MSDTNELLKVLRSRFHQWYELRNRAPNPNKLFQICEIEKLYTEAIIAVHDGKSTPEQLEILPKPYTVSRSKQEQPSWQMEPEMTKGNKPSLNLLKQRVDQYNTAARLAIKHKQDKLGEELRKQESLLYEILVSVASGQMVDYQDIPDTPPICCSQHK